MAKLEGDAAFAYVVTDVIDGSILQDAIEHCYIVFRRHLRDIGQASQCDCNACTYIPRLDLKFVVQDGEEVLVDFTNGVAGSAGLSMSRLRVPRLTWSRTSFAVG